MDRFVIKRPRLVEVAAEDAPPCISDNIVLSTVAVHGGGTGQGDPRFVVDVVDTASCSTATADIVLRAENETVGVGQHVEHDPASRFNFCRLSGMEQDFIISRGPHQPDISEVRLKKRRQGTEKELLRGGRYFQQRYYNREGKWVEYSIQENAIFCFPCRLFPPQSGNARDGFSCDGFTHFKNADARLDAHEHSEAHVTAVNRLLAYCPSTSTSNVSAQLDAEVQKELSKVQKRRIHLRAVFLRIFHAILYLAKQNIAFRGHNEKETSSNRGNFLELLNTISTFDPIMENFLTSKKVKHGTKRSHKTYLSPESQNRFINLLASRLREHIANIVKTAMFYSLQVDSTRDVAGHEQLSLILRIASSNGSAQQYFLGFYQCASQTAVSLEKFVLDTLEQLQIPLHLCRGVNFDGASNMSGRLNGLQARICRLVPKAIYFHCAAHRLNLVVVSACHCVREAVNFFGIVQSVYNFIACAPTRQALYEEAWAEVEEMKGKRMLTLKKLCEVRWGCQRRALRVLLTGYPAVMYALNTSLETMTDVKAVATARGLVTQLTTFEFVFCLNVFHPLLELTGICSDIFSGEGLDLCQMLQTVENLLNQLYIERSDDGFEKCWKAAEEFAMKHEIAVPAEGDCKARQKYVSKRVDANVKTQFHATTVKEFLRVDVFYPIYDTTRAAISSRFNDDSKPLVSAFTALFPNNLLTENDASSEKKVTFLLDHYDGDFEESRKLVPEWKLFRQEARSNTGRAAVSRLDSLTDVALWMTAENHNKSFKNVFQLYLIAITLGLTTVKNERAFSKLKLLETHLRSSMGQVRLSSLGLLAVEREELASLNIPEIISDCVDSLDMLH
jgi:hypothetical protein